MTDTTNHDETNHETEASQGEANWPHPGAWSRLSENQMTDQQSEQPDVQDDKPGREAARYRRQLRETEAELASVRNELEAARRTIVETELQGQLAKPSAVWLAPDVSVAALFDADGRPDRDAIRAAGDRAAQELGLARPSRPPVIPSQGTGNPRAGLGGNPIADALRGALY